MANAREIQTRIKSIQDTMKITNAMYMISSAKLKKARTSLENTQPYFQMLQGSIARILRHLPELEHPYFEAEENAEVKKDAKKRGYIVISADKGLAGAYNHNVMKLAEECLNHGKDNLIFVVGELGREYFTQHKIPIYKQFHYTVQDPNLTRARDIADFVISLYDEQKLDEIYVIYTYAVNSMQEEAMVQRLLPLKREALTVSIPADVYMEDIRMIPSAEQILDNVVPSYVTGFIYGALVESFCCEQNARMMAMEAATDNAEKILKELRITYNRVRQGAITQEITEVIAGARAQKKRRRRA
ncbi:MAG: ATP synthase F1 subunit gamma [Ruminococcus sp.]|nr:ATP synthase F1 subunit gamma [Ruminococcus sp.]